MSLPYSGSGFRNQQGSSHPGSGHYAPAQTVALYQPVPHMDAFHGQALINPSHVVQPIMIPVPVHVGPNVASHMISQPYSSHDSEFISGHERHRERRSSEELNYYLGKDRRSRSISQDKSDYDRSKYKDRNYESEYSSRHRDHSEERRLGSSRRSYEGDCEKHSRKHSHRHSKRQSSAKNRSDSPYDDEGSMHYKDRKHKHSKRDDRQDRHRKKRARSQRSSIDREVYLSQSDECDSYGKGSVDREYARFQEARDVRHGNQSHESSYRSRKRTGSPLSEMDDWEYKSRRVASNCSPISDISSHEVFSGEMKIHVNQGGRWIETNQDMSPISDHEDFDHVENLSHGGATLIENGRPVSSGGAILMEEGVPVGIGRPRGHHTVLMEEGVPVGLGRPKDEQGHRKDYTVSSKVYTRSEFDHFKVDPRAEVPQHDRIDRTSYRDSDRSEHGRFVNETERFRRDERVRRSNIDKPELSKVKTGIDLDCRIPNLCRSHNAKGCTNAHCSFLHICRHFIFSKCTFGKTCTKSHDFFSGQPFKVMLECNNHFKRSKMPTENEIIRLLYERMKNEKFGKSLKSVVSVPQSQDHASTEGSDSIEENTEFDEFDARRYAGSKYKKTSETSGNVDKKRDKSQNKKKDEKHEKKKQSSANEKEQQPKREQLSPISAENDEEWETIDKYDKVSDDEFDDDDHAQHDLKDDLDDVSSDGSHEDTNNYNGQSEVNLQFGANVGVPIGMNEPLVFNPNKGKPPQALPMYMVQALPGQLILPGQIPAGQILMNVDVKPPPTILQQVIQSLPPYEYKAAEVVKEEPPEDIDIKKEVEDEIEKDIKTVEEYAREHNEDEPESEMKEFIKDLWKFPHKGMLNMSVIDFVTETDAYQDELIAEILRIMITLDLPYVTMKKLISLIKDRLSIAITSTTDLRKILEMYQENFKIIETVDSEDEDEGEVKKNVQIQAKVELGFCEKHGFLPFFVGKCDCNSLHICKFHFLNSCPLSSCKFGHTLKTGHNVSVLKRHRLHRMTGEEIQSYMQDFDNRGTQTTPGVCKYYNNNTVSGCYKGSSVDPENICHNLHICYHFAKGHCHNSKCKRAHSIRDEQPFGLLQLYGLDPNEVGDENVLQLVSKKLFAKEGEKVLKNEAGKRDGKIKNTNSSKTGIVGGVKVEKDGQGVKEANSAPSGQAEGHDSKVPSVCKFYNNAGGCKKKDWGPEGICYFLHICQHYVLGECKFGSGCKRSHDLFSGHAAILLNRYGIDTSTLTAGQILNRLNKTTGTPVEIPKLPEAEMEDDSSSDEGVQSVDAAFTKRNEPENNANVSDKGMKTVKNMKVPTFQPKDKKIETVKAVNVTETATESCSTSAKDSNVQDEVSKVSGILKKSTDVGTTAQRGTGNGGALKDTKKVEDTAFKSCNIEEVIQHIINEKRVDKLNIDK